jgi:hypothetical protein
MIPIHLWANTKNGMVQIQVTKILWIRLVQIRNTEPPPPHAYFTHWIRIRIQGQENEEKMYFRKFFVIFMTKRYQCRYGTKK